MTASKMLLSFEKYKGILFHFFFVHLSLVESGEDGNDKERREKTCG